MSLILMEREEPQDIPNMSHRVRRQSLPEGGAVPLDNRPRHKKTS